MSTVSPAFWTMCLPIRLCIIATLCYLLKRKGRGERFMRIVAGSFTLVVGLGFLYTSLALGNARFMRKAKKGEDANAWWRHSRPLHFGLWTMVAILILSGGGSNGGRRSCAAIALLLADIAVSVLTAMHPIRG
eukprot:5552107-Pleurochrysis_carterae.AAC.2